MANTPHEYVYSYINTVNKNALNLTNGIYMLAGSVKQQIDSDRLILILGNGGSAADAQHFCGELMGRYKKSRLPVPCLTLPDISSVSGISNDFGYDLIMSRTIEAFKSHLGLVILLSTSGMSENVIKAAEFCRHAGLEVICITKSASHLASLCEKSIQFDSEDSGIVQQLTMILLHGVCDVIDL